MFTQSEKAWLDRVIETAGKKCKKGFENNEAFRQQVERYPAVAAKTTRHEECISDNVYIPQLRNSFAPEYNASPINETNCVAVASPQSRQYVASFFRSIMRHRYVKHIVAFGDSLGGDQPSDNSSEYYNYIAPENSEEKFIHCHDSDEKPEYEIQANYLIKEGSFRFKPYYVFSAKDEKPVISLVKLTCVEKRCLEEKLEEAEVQITFFSGRSSVNLEESPDEVKELFWQHYCVSLRGLLVVGCASGVGVTGEFIFTLKLVELFSKTHDVFSKISVENAAERIEVALDQIRKTRPGLVWTKKHLEMAIRNAFVLRKYALDKKYNFAEYVQMLDLSSSLQWDASNIDSHAYDAQPSSSTNLLEFDIRFDAVNKIYEKQQANAASNKAEHDTEYNNHLKRAWGRDISSDYSLARLGHDCRPAVRRLDQLPESYRVFLRRPDEEKIALNQLAAGLISLITPLEHFVRKEKIHTYWDEVYKLICSDFKESKKQGDNLAFKYKRKFLLYRSVQIAEEKFIQGIDNNKHFAENLERFQLKKYIRKDDVCGSTREVIPQFNDQLFPNYNANVTNTNFIPAAGAKTPESVATFFKSIVPHIRYIVAIGWRVFGGECLKKIDFQDYMAPGNKSADHTVTYAPAIPAGHSSPPYYFIARYQDGEDPLSIAEGDGGRYSPNKKPVEVTIKLKYINVEETKSDETEIHVLFLTLMDGGTFNLESSGDALKEIFLKYYTLSLTEPQIVHCASGVGRTGHYILTQLILQFLLQQQDILLLSPEQAAEGYLKVLDQIRQTRPGLVWVKDQFGMAIRNAFVLHEYALEKGYKLDCTSRVVLTPTVTPAWTHPDWEATAGREQAEFEALFQRITNQECRDFSRKAFAQLQFVEDVQNYKKQLKEYADPEIEVKRKPDESGVTTYGVFATEERSDRLPKGVGNSDTTVSFRFKS